MGSGSLSFAFLFIFAAVRALLSWSAPTALGLVASVPAAQVGGALAGSQRDVEPSAGNNLPPVVVVDLEDDRRVRGGDLLRFTVTATDPEGGRVSLRVLNPQPGMIFHPLHKVASPATGEVRWELLDRSTGLRQVVFEARDEWRARTRLTLTVRVEGTYQNALQPQVLGDVTGDGFLDVVPRAGTLGGALWLGGSDFSSQPSASLDYPPGVAASFPQFADVTGDGVLDLVVTVTGQLDPVTYGAVCVWAGGASFGGAPDVVLSVADPAGGLGSRTAQLADVTGDGVRDIVIPAPFADWNGVENVGIVYVWKGGASLLGASAPTATLRDPNAVPYDQLCYYDSFNGEFVLEDVTGDGVLDVVASAPRAEIGGQVFTGALYVWEGGASLQGETHATAKLSAAGTSYLGGMGSGPRSLIVRDLTGDGTADVIGADLNRDAYYLWQGGSTLSGTLPPTATLSVPGVPSPNYLSFAFLADVSGDARPDFVARAPFLDVGGVQNTGAVYVWKAGSTYSGATAPDASLSVSYYNGFLGQDVIRAVDLTRDGILDLVASTDTDPFRLHVWSGGTSLSGSPAAHSTLDAQFEVAYEPLPNDLQMADVTGDGHEDLVLRLGNELPDQEGVLCVWSQTHLTGTQSPTAQLSVSDASRHDTLQSCQIADVTGDGCLDLVAGTTNADRDAMDSGAIYVWQGGSSLVGNVNESTTLAVQGALPDDQLTRAGTYLVDVTGDNQIDVLSGTEYADFRGVNAGLLFVWEGGTGILGTPNDDTLYATGSDRLGSHLLPADLTGDGIMEVLGQESTSWCVWRAPVVEPGEPDWILTVP